jgi:hypothetical protein
MSDEAEIHNAKVRDLQDLERDIARLAVAGYVIGEDTRTRYLELYQEVMSY